MDESEYEAKPEPAAPQTREPESFAASKARAYYAQEITLTRNDSADSGQNLRFAQFLRADTNRDAGEKQYDYDDETPESDTVILITTWSRR